MGYLKIITICFWMSLGHSLSCYSQNNFFKLYTGNGYDYGQGIVQLPDSSYAVTGSSSSFTTNSQTFLMKLDKNGVFQWSKDFGGNESEIGRRVFFIPNLGYTLVGISNSNASGDFNIQITQTDVNGNLQWQKVHGGTKWEKVYDAKMLADSGLIIVGQTYSSSLLNSDGFIMRTDKHGDTLWTRNIIAAGEEIVKSMCIKDLSSFYVVGQMQLQDSLKTNGFIAEYHIDGSVLQFDTLYVPGLVSVNDLEVYGTQISCTGRIKKSSHPVDYGIILNMDLNANITGFSSVPQSFEYEFDKICKKKGINDLFLNIVYKNETPSFKNDQYISLYDVNLNWLNNQLNFVFEGEDEMNDLHPTNDGGAVFVGSMEQFGSGGSNVYVVKIGPNTAYPPTSINDIHLNPILSIGEEKTFYSAKIFPNPFQDFIKVLIDVKEEVNFELLNIQGESIQKGSFYGGYTIDSTNLKEGIYFLNLTLNGNTFTYKMVK